jgi:hypothetical protein
LRYLQIGVGSRAFAGGIWMRGLGFILLALAGCNSAARESQTVTTNSADPLDAVIRADIAKRQGLAPATKDDVTNERIAATLSDARTGMKIQELDRRVSDLERRDLDRSLKQSR